MGERGHFSSAGAGVYIGYTWFSSARVEVLPHPVWSANATGTERPERSSRTHQRVRGGRRRNFLSSKIVGLKHARLQHRDRYLMLFSVHSAFIVPFGSVRKNYFPPVAERDLRVLLFVLCVEICTSSRE